MKNKVIIIGSQNNTPENEVNEEIEKVNEQGWRAVSVKTELVLFGERVDEDFGLMPRHIFYVTSVLLESNDE